MGLGLGDGAGPENLPRMKADYPTNQEQDAWGRWMCGFPRCLRGDRLPLGDIGCLLADSLPPIYCSSVKPFPAFPLLSAHISFHGPESSPCGKIRCLGSYKSKTLSTEDRTSAISLGISVGAQRPSVRR